MVQRAALQRRPTVLLGKLRILSRMNLQRRKTEPRAVHDLSKPFSSASKQKTSRQVSKREHFYKDFLSKRATFVCFSLFCTVKCFAKSWQFELFVCFSFCLICISLILRWNSSLLALITNRAASLFYCNPMSNQVYKVSWDFISLMKYKILFTKTTMFKFSEICQRYYKSPSFQGYHKMHCFPCFLLDIQGTS